MENRTVIIVITIILAGTVPLIGLAVYANSLYGVDPFMYGMHGFPKSEMASASSGDTITLSADEYSFSIDNPTIRVKSGDTVRIAIFNHGHLEHDLVIARSDGLEHKDDTYVDEHEDDGIIAHSEHLYHMESTIIEFQAPEPGSYIYYCSVPGHKEAGMQGLFIVE